MRLSFAVLTLCLALLLAVACSPVPVTPAAGTPGTTDSGLDPDLAGQLTDTSGVTAPPLPIESTAAPAATPLPAPTFSSAVTTQENGLRYEDSVTGTGEAAKTGDIVVVNYVGYLADGTVFDSSQASGRPVTIVIGSNRFIPGWEQGLVGMQAGGQRLLEIPPELAYGAEGAGQGMIPPDSTLIFELTAESVTPAPPPTQVESYESTESGVEYAILTEGSGDPVEKNDLVTFDFKAWLEETGIMFDSSEQAGQPVQLPIGGSILPGLDAGIEGMLPGETRQIRIPPEQGYGAEGAGEVIPPNAVIIFEISLLEVAVAPELTAVDPADYTTTESGLQYVILQPGEGEVAATGDGVTMNYSGFLEDGTLFDSSVQSGQPFPFILGQGQVIPGWDEGIVGMQVGERRQLRIPSDLAYGEAGYPPTIPANATLIFDIELLAIEKGAAGEGGGAGAVPTIVPAP